MSGPALSLPSSMFPGSAEEVVPALHSMQQEPAWPALLAGHKPEDWPGSVPPPKCHQDLMYLTSEKVLSDESAQAIHSFYSFIWVCLARQSTLEYTGNIVPSTRYLSLATKHCAGQPCGRLRQCFVGFAG